MRVGVAAASAWGVGGRDPKLRVPQDRAELGAETAARSASFLLAPEPERPLRFPAATWRKMSRLARLLVTAAEPLVPEQPDFSLVAGVSGGEFVSSVAFLQSYFLKGAALSSPLAFQNSVHNAAAAHLSIGLGLRGASETVLGGADTLWRTLERAMAQVVVHGAPVLAVVAEDLSREVVAGLMAAGARGRWGEGAAAFLLVNHGGTSLTWRDGSAPDDAWGHAQPYLDEDSGTPNAAHAWDGQLGLGAGSEAVALAALLRSGSGRISGPRAWLEIG